MFVPVWFMIASPSMWLILLPLDFLVVTCVLWLCVKFFSVGSYREMFRASILKIWAINFASQILASFTLFLSQGYFGEWWYEYITTPVALNPLDNIYSVTFTALALLLAGAFTYTANRKFTFKKLQLDPDTRRKLALGLALLTLPMMYFMPSRAIYDPETPVYNFTSHAVWSIQSACEITPVAPVRVSELSSDASEYGYVLAEALNTAGRATATVERDPEYELRFYIPETDEAAGARSDVRVRLWFMDDGRVLMYSNAEFYLADEYQSARVLEVLEGSYVPGDYSWLTGTAESEDAESAEPAA